MTLTRPLAGEDAFQVCLLGTCQATATILQDRLKLCEDQSMKRKRTYWLEIMQKAIDGVDSTFDGYVTAEFEKRFEEYHNAVEVAITKLLRGNDESTSEEDNG